MARADVISAIRTHLESYARPDDSSTYFSKVYAHRPLGLAPFDKLCIFWLNGESTLPDAYRNNTFRKAMVAESWTIKCFWKPRPLEGARENLVLEQWDALRGVQELLRGDSKLGGNIDDLKIRQYPRIEEERYGENDAPFDVLTIEFDTWNLNAEAISA